MENLRGPSFTRRTHFFEHCAAIIIGIQPKGQFRQEPEPSQATGMALVRCILDKFLGVVCHCFPPPLDVPTFAASASTSTTTREILAAKGGTIGENVVR
jgi:hypothetical protein